MNKSWVEKARSHQVRRAHIQRPLRTYIHYIHVNSVWERKSIFHEKAKLISFALCESIWSCMWSHWISYVATFETRAIGLCWRLQSNNHRLLLTEASAEYLRISSSRNWHQLEYSFRTINIESPLFTVCRLVRYNSLTKESSYHLLRVNKIQWKTPHKTPIQQHKKRRNNLRI